MKLHKRLIAFEIVDELHVITIMIKFLYHYAC